MASVAPSCLQGADSPQGKQQRSTSDGTEDVPPGSPGAAGGGDSEVQQAAAAALASAASADSPTTDAAAAAAAPTPRTPWQQTTAILRESAPDEFTIAGYQRWVRANPALAKRCEEIARFLSVLVPVRSCKRGCLWRLCAKRLVFANSHEPTNDTSVSRESRRACE